MACQILSQGIDTIMYTPVYNVDYLVDYDDIDSIADYFTEATTSCKNGFPKTSKKGNTSEQLHQNSKHTITKVFEPIIFLVVPKPSIPNILFAYPSNERHHFLFAKDIIPEPPKA
ncbi:hypothetical protein ACFOW1_10865 [Parasediminibacterium paludis]|uniref:Uncharacterized protein n=1 Tax=Parasediminibacterium paludis TaxID=908966 RepID=A0ABV8PYP8_9BACT